MEAVCLLSVYCLAPCLSTLSGLLSSLHRVLQPLPLFHGSCTAPHFQSLSSCLPFTGLLLHLIPGPQPLADRFCCRWAPCPWAHLA